MKKTLLFMLVVFSALVAGAQERVVTGKVTAADDGQPVPGANILVKGTSAGTSTNADGEFSISVGSNAVLVISYIGYSTQEVTVGDQTVININLQADITSLADIVVVGYGEVQKKDLTGSVVSVNSSTFNKGVMMSPTDLLMGKVAGVQITAASGAPGSGSQIMIRGGSSVNASNAPLIVVDGFPLDNNAIAGSANRLNFINPNDVESITVLKDASATAIYGSRASNGVIIVTTKKGSTDKMQIAFNGQVSVSTPARYVDALSATEYKDMVTGLNGSYGINNAALAKLGNSNTDWQKQVYRAAISQDYNISVSGRKENFPYRVSYGMTDQQGILKTTKASRHSINASVSPTFLDGDLRVNANVKTMFAKNNFGDQGAVGSAVSFDPTQVVRNGNTAYGGYFTWVSDMNDVNSSASAIAPRNPVAMLNLRDNQSDVFTAFGNVKVDYRMPFLKELTATVNMGLDYSSSNGHDNTSAMAPWTSGLGNFTKYTGKTLSRLIDIYGTYSKVMGEHKLDVTGGYSYQAFQRDGSTLSRNNIRHSTYELNNDGDTVAYVDPHNYNFIISLFGRANYSYRGKYYVTATYRADMSSRFPENNRVGSFPAVALKWKLSEEGFLKGINQFSNLSVRFGYGVTGQQDVGSNPYPYLPLYRESNAAAQYQFGSTFINTLRPSAYDQSFKWEETSTTNVGLDFGLFGDRFTGSIDYYKRVSHDLINNTPIAAGSNFSNYLLHNVGDLTNQGVELSLSGDLIKKQDFSWSLSYNVAYNRNEITKLLDVPSDDYPGVDVGIISGGVGNAVQKHNIGQPRASFYVFQQVYGTNGKPIEGLYADRTGDGGNVVSNLRNKYYYFSAAPLFSMGVTSTMRYKQFDFFFAGRGNIGNYVYNNGNSNTYFQSAFNSNTNTFNNLRSSISDTNFGTAQYWSDIYVENASFFKMDNMSVGYSVDQLFDQKLRGRFSFTVQNAFMITKYSGIDPELANGIDNNLYPRPRVFLVGINLIY